MQNMINYLKWRGDLTFSQSAFNEVDNLILSYLAYVNLDDIIKMDEKRTIKELSKEFFSTYSEAELQKDRSFVRLAPEVMRAMANSARFQTAVLAHYVNDIQTKESTQFSAMEVRLSDNTTYVSFRGTDDTIVGWKEDFNLSNGVVPAQKKAVEYLNQIGDEVMVPLRVGGHSKGGNLCIYAASNCKEMIQNRIIGVYSNDGPGFQEEFFKKSGYKRVQSKIIRIVPECSVIGMIMNHKAEPAYIKSSQKGILQHDGMSWEVEGPSFVHLEAGDQKTEIFNQTLEKWLEEMTEKDRELFIRELFSILEVTGAQTLTELQGFRFENAKAMLKKVEKLDPRTKEIVEELLVTLIGRWKAFLPFSASS